MAPPAGQTALDLDGRIAQAIAAQVAVDIAVTRQGRAVATENLPVQLGQRGQEVGAFFADVALVEGDHFGSVAVAPVLAGSGD